MKKILVFLVCLCACIATSYAQQGESALGVNLNYGNDTNFGLGVKYRYNLSDHVRIEPAFNYYFKHDYVSMWDLNANFHYLCPVAENVTVYPLAGIGYANATAHLKEWGLDNESDGKITVNLGAGADFQVSSSVKLNLELKYQIIDDFNQLVLSAGVVFAF